MLDVLFIVLTVAFFALGVAYVVACDRLGTKDRGQVAASSLSPQSPAPSPGRNL